MLNIDSGIFIVLNIHFFLLPVVDDYPLERKISIVDQLFKIAGWLFFLILKIVLFRCHFDLLSRGRVAFCFSFVGCFVFFDLGFLVNFGGSAVELSFEKRIHEGRLFHLRREFSDIKLSHLSKSLKTANIQASLKINNGSLFYLCL